MTGLGGLEIEKEQLRIAAVTYWKFRESNTESCSRRFSRLFLVEDTFLNRFPPHRPTPHQVLLLIAAHSNLIIRYTRILLAVIVRVAHPRMSLIGGIRHRPVIAIVHFGFDILQHSHSGSTILSHHCHPLIRFHID